MTSSNQELVFLQESVPQLQEYLISNELYWPLGGSLPRLTIGSLLLALTRLQVLVPAEAKSLSAQVESVRAKWRAAWEKKAAREITNRMRLWSQFLADFTNAPDQNLESYATEARVRTILQLLLRELPDAAEVNTLAELDGLLKSRLIVSDFLWEQELQAVFPKSEFWFLYGKL